MKRPEIDFQNKLCYCQKSKFLTVFLSLLEFFNFCLNFRLFEHDFFDSHRFCHFELLNFLLKLTNRSGLLLFIDFRFIDDTFCLEKK